MGLDDVPKLRLGLAIVGFIFVFIGTALHWNFFDDEVSGLDEDLEASVNFYIFAQWIFAVACIGSIIKYSSTGVHNALIIFAFTMFASYFTGVPSATDARVAYSFSAITQLRSIDRNEAFDKLLAAGLIGNMGMLICVLAAALRKNISESGRIIKVITAAVVLGCAGVSCIIYWSTEDMNNPVNAFVYQHTAAILVVAFATILTVIGSHQGVAAFLLAFGGLYSIFALAYGLAISASFPDERDTARAAAVIGAAGVLTSLVPAFLVYQDESLSSTA